MPCSSDYKDNKNVSLAQALRIYDGAVHNGFFEVNEVALAAKRLHKIVKQLHNYEKDADDKGIDKRVGSVITFFEEKLSTLQEILNEPA